MDKTFNFELLTYFNVIKCPPDAAICGVSSAGEWEIADNVAITKLKFYCCTGCGESCPPQ